MNIIKRKESILLLVGDIMVLFVSLYLTITLRYGAIPSSKLLMDHLVPFSVLFIISLLINFIAGLYEKHTLDLKRKLPGILTRVQIINTIISISFFYFAPYFSIAPKITLFMYLIISLIFMVAWRMAMAQEFSLMRKSKALLLAHGNEADELFNEINNNQRYGTIFIEKIDISTSSIKSDEISEIIRSKDISLVVADFSDKRINELMPTLYRFIFSKVNFVDIQKMYEGVFDRIPLSFIDDIWFLENVSYSKKLSFDIFKRVIDIVISSILGIISLVFYPFIYIAIKLDDKGVIFSYQDRVGQNNKNIRIVKFRTMSIANDGGHWGKQTNNITRVGNILRKTRLDELPQLWNVFKGDISLVGPRPEFAKAVSAYSKEIPYYNIRHIVKPGLSGWAQIYGKHPHHGINMEETSNKLSYDLFYVKNRSLLLDLKIILQTIKVLISFVGI